MRVRLFTDPSQVSAQQRREGVVQDLPYVVALGRSIKKAGCQLMLDFHYSDTWADPAKQSLPRAWQGCGIDALCDSVYAHTRSSLRAMKAAGAAPDLIQVGNEITNGMLWPVAHIDPTADEGWPALCRLLQAGCRACREECPEARIIIHTEKAGSWPITYSYYRHLRQAGIDYDIIGLSYYPMWHGTIANLGHTLQALQREFPNKEVMVVEAAACYAGSHPEEMEHEVSVEGQRQFASHLTAELLRHDNVTGLFWWFPEENAHGNATHRFRLNRGLFHNDSGKALPALYELRNFSK